MSKDPMWIPKPPVLYGSDKLEIFQPYDPETPASTSPSRSPSCPGSPSDSSSSGSVTIPSLLTSIRATPPVSTSAVVAATQSISSSISDKNLLTAPSDKTPLQTILKTLFGNKQNDSTVSSDGSSTTTIVSDKKIPVFSQVSQSMVDPIVQQYGQKSKVKEIEQEENDFDRPYDPEEEYNPAMGYGMVASQNIEKNKVDDPALSGLVDDDVAYDPEDETIFEDIQSDAIVTKPHVQTSDSPSCPTPLSTTHVVAPSAASAPPQTFTTATLMPNLPTGTVVVSAATLTEQQRMLEELNKQIEEQKRQLKEQEEALRQQREAVGMFMAHFSVSDSLMSPPTKSLPLSQLSSQPTDKTSNPTESVDKSNVNSQTLKQEDTTAIPNLTNDTDTVTGQDETQEIVKESDKYSSAGEIEDSDVAYDPEDESLFNEIQEDVFQVSGMKTHDTSLSRAGHSVSRKGTSPNSHHSRKRRLSPKRRSHRERDCHRSPSRRSQRRSPSHSRRRRERDRHRRSERDRSRHRTRDQSERQARHRKEHTTRHRSRGHRRSPSSPRKKHSVSLSPKKHRVPSPQVLEKAKDASVPCNAAASVIGQFLESNTSSATSVTIKNDPDEHLLKCDLVESPDKDSSPCSSELLHSVKLEISEPPKSHKVQKDSVSDHDDNSRGSFTQVDKPSNQETQLNNKIETPVPLREIDPPIRDSPESPDPEPQFVKPSGIENCDSIKTEENRDPEIHSSVSVPFVKVENNCLPLGSVATLSNILWSTVGSPISDVRNFDFRALDLPGPGIRHQSMIEADKQTEGGTSGLKQSQMMGQEDSHSQSYTGSDIQGSQPEIDPVTKCPGPEMKEPGHRGSLTGIRYPGPDQRGAGMQGMNPNIWGPGTHIQHPGTGMHSSEVNIRNPGVQYLKTDRIEEVHGPDMGHSEQDIRGKKSVTAVINSQLANADSRSGVMEVAGAQSFVGPQIEDRAQDIIGRGRGLNNRGGCLHTQGMRSSIRGGGVRGQSPGPPFGGSRRVLEDCGTQKRGFQPHGKNADFSRVGGGPQRGQGVRIRGARPNKNCESVEPNMSYIAQDSNEPEAHFKKSQADTRAESNVHGPDMSESETTHELRERDIAGSSYMGPGQDMDSVRDVEETGSDRRDADMQRRNIHGPGLLWRNEQMGQEQRGPMHSIKNLDWRGPGVGGVGPDMVGQRSQHKGLDPHMRDLEWSDPGPGIRDDWRGIDRRGSGSVRGRPFKQNEWRVHKPERREPNMESLGPGRGSGGSEFIAPELEKRGPDLDVPVYDGRGRGGPDFRRQEPERKGPTMDNLEPGMRGPGVECTGIAMEGPGTDRRGPGGPYFRGPGPEKEGQGHDMRGAPGPDFRGPWPGRRGPDMVTPGTDRRGPEGQDVWGLGPERRGPAVEGPGTDRRGPRGPEFRGPGAKMSGPTMEGLGIDRRGLGSSDFRGPGPESRGLCMEGPGLDMGSSGGPNFRGPRPERRSLSMECPGTDRRGLAGQNFWGQGLENEGLFVEDLGPDNRGFGGPAFSGPGPEKRGPPMGAAEPDSRRPIGPDFTGPGPDKRVPPMGGLGSDRRESGTPDLRGPGHKRRGPCMDNQETDKRRPGGPDFQGPEHENRGLAINRPGPERRGPGGSDLIGPSSERRGPSFEGRGPNRIEDQNSGVLGPNRRGSYMGDPGPDCIGLGPERSGEHIEGQGPQSRGRGGLHFRVPGPESGHRNMKGPSPGGRGSDLRGTPWLEGPGMEGLGPNRRGPGGSNFRGPGAERRPLDIEETENNCSFPGGPQFGGSEQERRPSDMEGPEPDRRIPHLRQVEPERSVMEGQGKGPRGSDFRGPDIVGLGPDRQEPGGSGFRELGSERRGLYMEGSGPDWRRSGCSAFSDPGIRQKGRNTEGPIHDNRDEWGGSDFRGSEPMQGTPDIEGPGPERTVQPLRGIRPMRRKIRGRGNNMRSLNQGDRWKGTDTDDQWSDRRGPNMERANETERSGDNWKRHCNRGSDEQGQDHSRQGPHGDWRGPGSRGPGPIQERSNMPFPGPMRGPRDDWSGPGCRDQGPVHDSLDIGCPGASRGGTGNEWKAPDRGGSGPDRRGPGPFFRGERDPDNVGQGHDRIGLGTRGSDMGNDFRGNMRRPNIKGAADHRGEPDMMNSGPNERGFEMEGGHKIFPRGPDSRHMGPENRNSNIEGPRTDGRFSDCGGLGSERPGVDMESHGPDRQGFEHDFRRERRGPDLRRPGNGPDKISDLSHGPGRWDTNTDVSQFDARGPTMIGPGVDSRGSEPPMKSDMQASDVRGPGYVNRDPDMRHREPGQKGQTNSNERRSPALRHFDKSESHHLNNPHQVARFQGPSHPHSAPFNRPPAPAPNSGRKSFPSFDSPQNQQAVKPQRHRAALLPTPTEGLIRFPNCMINNPDVFSLKQKQMGHCTAREWSRGRPVSRERDLVKGHRQEQEKGPAGKINTSVDVSTGDGGEKIEQEK